MKVFISWSGDLSRKVGELLADWIPNVLQHVEAWFSPDDIEKGEVWFGALTKQLAEIKVGVICLTPENLTAPWILFEAGSISNELSKSRVCTFLVGLEPDALPSSSPLYPFQHTKNTKEDMFRLLKTINAAAEKPLPEARVQNSFEIWWPSFDTRLKEILSTVSSMKAPPAPDQKAMVTEILQLARSVHSMLQVDKTGHEQEFFRRYFLDLMNKQQTLSDYIAAASLESLVGKGVVQSLPKIVSNIHELPSDVQQKIERTSRWADVVRHSRELGIPIAQVRHYNETDADVLVDSADKETMAKLTEFAKAKGFKLAVGTNL